MKSSRWRVVVCLAQLVLLGGCDRIKSLVSGDSPKADAATPSQPSSTLALLQGFEGEVDVLLTPPARDRGRKPPTPLALLVKSDNVRIDLPDDADTARMLGKKAYVLVNPAEKRASFVMDDRRQAVVLDIEHAAEKFKGIAHTMKGQVPGEVAARNPPKVTKTGQSDHVAGYACENWMIVDDKGDKTIACIADEGASWLRFSNLGLPSEYAWMGELLDGKHFPLRLVHFERDGSEGERIELTKIERKPLVADAFQVPTGYELLSLEQMLQQVMSLGMRPGLPPVRLDGGVAPSLMRADGGLPRGSHPAVGVHPGLPVAVPTVHP